MAGERGTALLLAAATAATLAALATVLLAMALTTYESAAWRIDGVQARLLADAALSEVEVSMAAGILAPPSDGSSAEWIGVLPAAPPGFTPLQMGARPEPAAPPKGGCGYRATVRRIAGPDGALRTWSLPDRAGARAWLVEVAAEGWCGRGLARQSARFAVLPGQLARRLD